MRWIVLLIVLLASSCTGEQPTGQPCSEGADCVGGLCLRSGFTEGYCSQPCEIQPCEGGQRCARVGEQAVCLAPCGAEGCRTSYQCLLGLCQPRCRDDSGCPIGQTCAGGICGPRPGAALGASCESDEECQSARCVADRCARGCERDSDCETGATCTLDRDADEPRGVCATRRGGQGPLAGCQADTSCDLGSCLMGACLQLCATPQDCQGGGAARSCSRVPAPLAGVAVADLGSVRSCLPRNGRLTTTASRTLLVPETARSVLLFSSVEGYPEDTVVGLSLLRDREGRVLYRLPGDEAGYYDNLLRAAPDFGCSSLLLSSSPRQVAIAPGGYPFVSAAERDGAPVSHTVTAIYKLYDAPTRAGRVPLRVHITDLSGLPDSCALRDLNERSAPTLLAGFLKELLRIYAQDTVRITLDPITFVDSDAPSSIAADDPGSLDAVLRAASAATSGGLDLVLVRSITPRQVLGISGGIPASPGLAGTPNTGAAASVVPLCIPGADQRLYAATIGHELGHTLGLSHNRESDGHADPLGDGSAESESSLQQTDNLMYWAAGDGSKLTDEQGQVLRSMPQVTPE